MSTTLSQKPNEAPEEELQLPPRYSDTIEEPIDNTLAQLVNDLVVLRTKCIELIKERERAFAVVAQRDEKIKKLNELISELQRNTVSKPTELHKAG